MALARPAGADDSRGALPSPTTQRRIATVLPPLLVGLLALPFVLWQNSWWEWATPFWLLQRQAAHVSAHGMPTLFLHTTSGAFNPFFAFYGGFTLSVLAYPAAVFGAWPVFVAATVTAMAAGYLGIWWTARNLGLSHRLAVLPALTFSTTPYLVSDLYGRGAWAELIAVNAAAVMLGAVTALLWRPERRGAGPLAALASCGAIVAGTHNITLLLSAVALPLIVLAVLPLAPRGVTTAGTVRRLAQATVAAALGVGSTGAWLIPSLWLGPDTWVALPGGNDKILRARDGLLDLTNVLSPWPVVPHTLTLRWIYAQAPVLPMLWALVACALVAWARRRRPDRVVAVVAGLTVLGAALLLLVVEPQWWLSFPAVVKVVQLPYRLIPYLGMVIALGVVVGLTGAAPARRRWMTGALVVAVVVQVAAAGWLVVNSEASGSVASRSHAGDVRLYGEPASFSTPGFMTQYQFRVVRRPTGPVPKAVLRTVDIGNVAQADVARMRGTNGEGDRLRTPIVWSPLVRVTGGARIAGRDRLGLAIVEVTHTDALGRWTASARPQCAFCAGALDGDAPWQLLAARLLTLASALALAAAALVG
ncbi:MAG: hypothetical protein JWP53_804, partial [Conexibacter sp.]|nr:hypothetical protein [Conexibacter sp.]